MIRVGHGWDVHKLVEGKPLVLGGIEIPSDRGPDAHSDGDAVLHAVIDSLFGAAGAGDIGDHFPDNDPAYKDADSSDLLGRALEIIKAEGAVPANVDVTLVLETPKLGDLKNRMRDNIAGLLGLPPGRVNVKAKTREGMGHVGKGKAVEAFAVAAVEFKTSSE
jgi:2-C-methyl-D-erythritol 2,4-cyclodiphosphate synthase